MWNAFGVDSICLRVNWIFKSLRWKLYRASKPVYDLVDNKSQKKPKAVIKTHTHTYTLTPVLTSLSPIFGI